MRIGDAAARADRRAERHHGRRAGVRELAARNRIVIAIGQHHEAATHQRLGGAQQFLDIRVEQFAVADHLELDPVGLERLAGELRREDRILRGVAAGRVRQQMHPAFEQLAEALVVARETDAAHRRGCHLSAARRERIEHHLAVGITCRPEKQAGSEGSVGDRQRIQRLGHLLARLSRLIRLGGRARSRSRRPAARP